jgi:hypothetical protein
LASPYYTLTNRDCNKNIPGFSRTADFGQEFLFRQDRHAKLAGLGQLAAGIGAGEDEAGLLADRPAGAATEADDQFFNLGAGEFFQCAGDDYRLAGKQLGGRGASTTKGFCPMRLSDKANATTRFAKLNRMLDLAAAI